jgi:hypothetical protein
MHALHIHAKCNILSLHTRHPCTKISKALTIIISEHQIKRNHPITAQMDSDINALMETLDELQRFEKFAQIRKYHVELLQYWAKMLVFRFQSQSTEGYFETLSGLTSLATHLGLAAGTPQFQSNRDRLKYSFLSEKIFDMVSFLTSYPDMVQLSDLLRMYAVQIGRLRFLEDGLREDECADGMDQIAEDLCPKWRQNREHWHCAAWTELQRGMTTW